MLVPPAVVPAATGMHRRTLASRLRVVLRGGLPVYNLRSGDVVWQNTGPRSRNPTVTPEYWTLNGVFLCGDNVYRLKSLICADRLYEIHLR
eukprot:3850761-Rhodomonas_salina.2